MSDDTDYFDQMAKNYDSDPKKLERARKFVEAILSEVNIDSQFVGLDYGCGTGLSSFFLAPYMQRIVLADNSPGMLETLGEKIAASDIKNLIPAQLDLVHDELTDERFDLIFTLMTMHHIVDTAAILRKFYTLLKTPGYLCIGDLNKEDGFFHNRDFSGHNGFDLDELMQVAKSVGFKNIRQQTFFTMKKIVKDNQEASFPLFLLVAEK